MAKDIDVDEDEILEFRSEGEEDPRGVKIDRVYYSTRKYQIYEAGGGIWHELPDSYEVAKVMRNDFFKIATEWKRIENLGAHKAVRESDRGFIKTTLARCMAQAFEGDPDGALPILKKIQARLETVIESYYRMKYVAANAFFAAWTILALLFVLSLLSITRNYADWTTISNFLPMDGPVLERYAKLFILGALGAFLSVTIGAPQLRVNINLDDNEHKYGGGARIIIGVIGALVIGLALDSKFISPGFGEIPNPAVYYFLAFVAGFSETLVPNTLRRAEQKASREQDKADDEDDG